MTVLLFSGFLAIQNPVPFEDPTHEALRYGSKALFYELHLDQKVEGLEKKLIPEKLKPYAPAIGIVGRLVAEQRLSYTWRF